MMFFSWLKLTKIFGQRSSFLSLSYCDGGSEFGFPFRHPAVINFPGLYKNTTSDYNFCIFCPCPASLPSPPPNFFSLPLPPPPPPPPPSHVSNRHGRAPAVTEVYCVSQTTVCARVRVWCSREQYVTGSVSNQLPPPPPTPSSCISFYGCEFCQFFACIYPCSPQPIAEGGLMTTGIGWFHNNNKKKYRFKKKKKNWYPLSVVV